MTIPQSMPGAMVQPVSAQLPRQPAALSRVLRPMAWVLEQSRSAAPLLAVLRRQRGQMRSGAARTTSKVPQALPRAVWQWRRYEAWVAPCRHIRRTRPRSPDKLLSGDSFRWEPCSPRCLPRAHPQNTVIPSVMPCQMTLTELLRVRDLSGSVARHPSGCHSRSQGGGPCDGRCCYRRSGKCDSRKRMQGGVVGG